MPAHSKVILRCPSVVVALRSLTAHARIDNAYCLVADTKTTGARGAPMCLRVDPIDNSLWFAQDNAVYHLPLEGVRLSLDVW